MKQSAILTVAYGHSTEHLDYTFLSFAEKNPSVPLHAFVIGQRLPERRLPQITYHLIEPVPDFSHPLREVYFRRMLLVDEIGADYVLSVDSYDVLCLQSLPSFESLVGDAAFGACTEHLGARYIMGQGYTANFLNCGVVFWNVKESRMIREEVVARGRSHFRTVADDQFCLNEVVQTKFYDRVRILPCQYNYRCHIAGVKQRTWATVEHLDGVMIYHNATCMDAAKKMVVKPRADLPALQADGRPLTSREQFFRRLRNRLKPHIVK